MTSSLSSVNSNTASSALVITGDCDLASVIETALSATSMSCTRANTMYQAAKLLQGGMRPGMILIDLSTEEAVKFVREAKKIPALAKVPMLAVTEDPSMPEVKSAIEAGANRWITKSFIVNTLFAVVRQLALI
jgi:DNA-binding response OmpR family regulator